MTFIVSTGKDTVSLLIEFIEDKISSEFVALLMFNSYWYVSDSALLDRSVTNEKSDVTAAVKHSQKS